MSVEAAVVTLLLMLVAQLPSVITSIVAYIKSKTAIDENTRVTKEGTSSATINAKKAAAVAMVAATSAADAKVAAEVINTKLNGGIDDAINTAIAPLVLSLEDHARKDEQNMAEVRKALKEFIAEPQFKAFSDYIHKRNHDFLNAMHEYNTKISLVIAKMDATQSGSGV